MTAIRAMVLTVVICAMGVTGAQGVMELTYTPSGTDTIVTAADGATTYWEMIVDTSSTRPGRIMSFIDKSGASDDTFSYAFTYSFGSGLIDAVDGGEMRASGKWTISNLVMDPSGMSYTISRDLTRDTGAATYSMDYSIGLPTVTAEGYDTNVHIHDTFYFDADWVGSNSDARVEAVMRLAASADNDEYTVVTHNGYTDGAPTDKMIVEATATGAEPAMAAGSTITQTLTYGLHDGAYDLASGTYSAWAGPHLFGQTTIGTTGTWAANPGPAGAERTYTADVDVDISIVAGAGPAPGDADGDGDVDLDDFVILKNEFGTTAPPALQADFDGDGDVDLDDFVILKTNFGLGA